MVAISQPSKAQSTTDNAHTNEVASLDSTAAYNEVIRECIK
eukprot:CAMPEP_0170611464 /NCGR_PEP_ID=MMETSP0224-20130122/23203_1 /TAXON_ID=285029 /ORGANISM="Togula jolla, Strain CCCM 725" /LENGTH=40 /DNA_ID= /DNA_START= /DNA_END= /DNA_ORIENTATION=